MPELASLYDRIMTRGGRPVPAPPPVDLVRESERARAAAELASVEAGYAPDDQGNWRPREPLPRAWEWPEPYGPDPVVFGVVPRFKGPVSD